MGHTACGAIDATLEAIAAPGGAQHGNMRSIVNRVRPAIEALARTELARDPERLRHESMRANVRASVNHLRHGSDVIERLADEDNLLVVGAELDLTTGIVDFFEGVPEAPTVGLSEKQ
jgi:carbonic anhydrase